MLLTSTVASIAAVPAAAVGGCRQNSDIAFISTYMCVGVSTCRDPHLGSPVPGYIGYALWFFSGHGVGIVCGFKRQSLFENLRYTRTQKILSLPPPSSHVIPAAVRYSDGDVIIVSSESADFILPPPRPFQLSPRC